MKDERAFRRGEIYLADLGTRFGSEQGGIRPVLILQNNLGNIYCPTLIVAPLTTQTGKKPNQPTHYKLAGDGKAIRPSTVLLEQITTIDKRRVAKRLVKFPTVSSMTSTILVLKTPKTTSSVRKVYMPSAVARMLVEWKQAQDEKIELLGAEYQNYDLVFAGSLGMPTEASTINDALHRLIKEHDLPPIVFHSLRHSSITYKLKLNGGDIKAVQGDSGHSQAKMVTDTYSHILDDGRKNNALLFQEAFYEAKTEPKEKTPEGLSPETLSKMLANPEVMALLTALAKQMG